MFVQTMRLNVSDRTLGQVHAFTTNHQKTVVPKSKEEDKKTGKDKNGW